MVQPDYNASILVREPFEISLVFSILPILVMGTSLRIPCGSFSSHDACALIAVHALIEPGGPWFES